MAQPMAGKMVKFAIGTKENLMKMNKIFQKVEMYIDGESGCLYICPVEEPLVLENEMKNEKQGQDIFEK